MKVAICIPVYSDTVKTRFAASLFSLGLYAAVTPFRGERLELDRFMATGLLPLSRNAAAEEAAKWGADWLLWLDSDMTFPPDTLHRLLSHDKRLVGTNCRTRTRKGVSASCWEFGKRVPVETNASKGLERVDATGLAVVLVSGEAMRAISANGPPFEFGVNRAGGMVTEDNVFFDKARRAGFSAYVDHTLSMEVGHLAETELRFGR